MNIPTWFKCCAPLFVVLLSFSLRAESVVILSEGFEGLNFLSNRWSQIDLYDPDNSSPQLSWGVVDSGFGGEGTHSGSNKVYCAGRGYLFNVLTPAYPSDMSVRMTRTNIDLRSFTNATLSFWYKVKIPDIQARYEILFDYMAVLLGEDGLSLYETWELEKRVTNWTQVTLSLNDFLGTVQTLSFDFYSDSSNEPFDETDPLWDPSDPEYSTEITARSYEGIYLDDILITGEGSVGFKSITTDSENVNLLITGAIGRTYEIEESTDLVFWTPLTEVVATNTTFLVTDSLSEDAQFYRIILP